MPEMVAKFINIHDLDDYVTSRGGLVASCRTQRAKMK